MINLRKRADLNGRKGVIIGLSDNDRFMVKTKETASVYLVRCENLWLHNDLFQKCHEVASGNPGSGSIYDRENDNGSQGFAFGRHK